MNPFLDFWAADLGVGRAALDAPGATRVPGAEPGASFAFRHEGTGAVVVQGTLPVPADPLDPAAWGPGHRFVGPAWLGAMDDALFDPALAAGAGPLGDMAALAALQAAVEPWAWEHSGIEVDGRPIYGAFDGGVLAAAGMAELWGERLWHLGIVAHPAHRGRGHARAVVAAMALAGVAAGMTLQYRTLAANAPSVAIARRLGFPHMATTLSIRRQPG